jgi:outer membrane porin, OprD family
MKPLYALLPLVVATQAAQADFIEDSKGSLQIRNYYFDHDFQGGTGLDEMREWAQGFIFKADSGYTEGPVQFGLSFIGMTGFQLDSSPDRTGTGLLSYNTRTREVHDNYSKAGVSARFKVSNTELQVGHMTPLLPIMFPVTARLFPPLFRGSMVTSGEIQGLTLRGGYFDRQKYRDSTEDAKLRVSGLNGRFDSTAESSGFMFGGGDYKILDNLTGSYYYAQLNDIYKQHYVGLTHTTPLGPGALKSEAYYFDSSEDGAAKAGRVDNGNLNLNAAYTLGANTFSLGYMHLSGDTAMPYLASIDPYVMVGGALGTEYLNPKERVWQVKHDYDFAKHGLPGLKTQIRFIQGRNIHEPVADGNGEEWERDLEVSYTVQSGSLAGLGLRVRHGHYQNNFSRDVEQTRVNVDYTLALW